MSPGIGLMDRRLKTEKDAISLAMSGILKEYKTESEEIKTLETKYDDDAGDWYVALGWDKNCLLYTSPSPRDAHESRMPSSA